jgi:DNA-binding transcriptional LysR family regulator
MRRINIDTQLLRSFVAVADAGGFARAADRLNMTQPTMSQQMRRLEEMLGQALFRRDGRRSVLTPQGELVLGYARRIIELNDKIPVRLAGEAEREVVHLGMPEHFSETLLPLIMAAVYERYPNVQLVVKVGRSQTLAAALDEGRLHLAITLEEHDRTKAPPLHVAPMAWFGSPDMPLPDEDAGEIPLVLFSAPCGLRSLVIRTLEQAARPWRCMHEGEELSALRAAVQVRIGVTALPAFQIYPGIQALDAPRTLPRLPEIAVSLRPRRSWRSRTAPDLERLVIDVWNAFRTTVPPVPAPLCTG